MIIAVDFDGTCVTHAYPDVGKDIGAAPVLRWLVEQGHQIILWTMRSGTGISNPAEPDKFSKYDLQDAIDWFADNDIELLGVNENPDQHSWTKSPKAYAQIYIDDAALGCPLIFNSDLSDRPFVNWEKVKKWLEAIFDGKEPIGHTKIYEPKKRITYEL